MAHTVNSTTEPTDDIYMKKAGNLLCPDKSLSH